ncbi:MAG: cytochrome-c peroxidase [Deltaproteobacteria bacterium]|nr:cytochrome-c peroxidase [Deltaproteobacteria bacterium]
MPVRSGPAVLLAAGALCIGALPAQAASREEIQKRAQQLFGALPAEAASPANPVTPAKIELGRRLYYEKRLSLDQELSCNSCHGLTTFGVDNEPTSEGHEGQHGARNSPTVFNAAFHFAQFWDGRAKDVEEQAKGPVLNPVEMAMPSPEHVVAVLASIPGYRPLFEAAFPGEADPITFDNFAKAVGAFERRLVTPSRFDDFLAGQQDALSDAELAGLETFMDTGCPTCHAGATLGAQMFQKLGLVHPYPTKDLGRFDVSKQDTDKSFFKVPSLRNVEKAGPWFHDGSVTSLDEAIRLMAWHQLGKELAPAEVASIATFLRSLTGRVDLAFVAEPEPLPSGPTTPKPGAP